MSVSFQRFWDKSLYSYFGRVITLSFSPLRLLPGFISSHINWEKYWNILCALVYSCSPEPSKYPLLPRSSPSFLSLYNPATKGLMPLALLEPHSKTMTSVSSDWSVPMPRPFKHHTSVLPYVLVAQSFPTL